MNPLELLNVSETDWYILVACANVIALDRKKEKDDRDEPGDRVIYDPGFG